MTSINRLIVVAALVAACGPGVSSNPDAAGADAERIPDAGPPPDALGADFGQACGTATDCEGGMCVAGPDGSVCTYGCTGNCPLGWECRVTEVDGVLASLCMPTVVSSCVPCTEDDQCPGGACIEIGGGMFCLAGCFEGSCPEGYSCEDDPSGEHAGGFCVPDTGTCDCNADNDGALRTCENPNALGTCYGVEVCDAETGWGACNAPSAGLETCNGMDDDCDFLIDDGLSGGACQVTNANGSCPGTAVCTGVGGLVCQGQVPEAESCDYADNNCNGSVDEGYANLGDLCSDGDGGCERFGVIRCDTAGTGTECSAVEGPPQPELCNAIDDDCMGDIDETWENDLGDSCSAGVGACTRQGNLRCRDDGSGTECSASPGPTGTEACNTIDDDCDTRVDENWRVGGTGAYNHDQACGSCAVDCTVIYDVPNATGDCVVSGSPGCVMVCDANSFNLDSVASNGCEFVLDTGAIYVSINGGVNDATCGGGPPNTTMQFAPSANHPCQTIAYGQSRATATGRTRVLVANGIYTESVTINNGQSLMGGYAADNWVRNAAASGTQITGTQTVNGHLRTVSAVGITSTTLFEGFVVFGGLNSATAGNSYAIYVSGSDSDFTIRQNTVFGGRGGPGSTGGSGADGDGGEDGTGRESGAAAYDAKDSDNSPCTEDRAQDNGGVKMCGGDDVSGGDGGGNNCPPTESCTCTGAGCTSCTLYETPSQPDEVSGIDGTTGQPGSGGAAGGDGGDAGDDGVETSFGCYLPDPDPMYGEDGEDGAKGANGASGAGCSDNDGAVAGGEWIGDAGGLGGLGQNGGGGGGGGAGGGSRTQLGGGADDNIGGIGGGGGSGGCGGTGGLGGTAGGGVFAIFITGSSGQAPTINNNSLIRGEGGRGGGGGVAGAGGEGGLGAGGGLSGEFCTDVAGRGGDGGSGGHGAGGGGGCGGGSFGIYSWGVGTGMNYCQAAALNTISSGGGGAGGPGGYSLINQGTGGLSGLLGDCTFR